MTYCITPKSERDLLSIGHYTLKQWGESQHNSYLKSIVDRFTWLCDYLELGTNRDDIREGYYFYHEGKHLIFYMIDRNHINIIGVLRERMDYKVHL